jgi:hypothetical protein
MPFDGVWLIMKSQREARTAVDEGGMGSVARKAIAAATSATYALIVWLLLN